MRGFERRVISMIDCYFKFYANSRVGYFSVIQKMYITAHPHVYNSNNLMYDPGSL
ncbi:hypothetical protein XSR1_130017 [Xenorhabdus szentirmaii DSM 16338]|uniref:Uncharacterized protein n=1 Tax=Xenorhabdus szentirmaii DSM 16338 TaxID=1427518 RepID=W1IUZ2_9GAMM|nr:hypothetical protein XSR1_130017 [Xenorhabdus szentirmaii DSM 16338]